MPTNNSTKLSNLENLEVEINGFKLRSNNTKIGFQTIKPKSHQEMDMEIEQINKRLTELLPRLGKHKIEIIQQHIQKYYKARFQGKRHNPKYGNLNKGFTEPQLQAFFIAINNPKYKLLFKYQATLGLRIGEVVKLNIKDIRFDTQELVVLTEKAKNIDTLYIPDELFKETNAWIEDNRKEIEECEGYIFFRDAKHSNRQQGYVEPNYMRKVFMNYCRDANLIEKYGESTELISGRSTRTLTRLTTHSLRHYAITQFSKRCNGNLILTSKFARHSEPTITMTYINTDKTELYAHIKDLADNKEMKLGIRTQIIGKVNPKQDKS